MNNKTQGQTQETTRKETNDMQETLNYLYENVIDNETYESWPKETQVLLKLARLQHYARANAEYLGNLLIKCHEKPLSSVSSRETVKALLNVLTSVESLKRQATQGEPLTFKFIDSTIPIEECELIERNHIDIPMIATELLRGAYIGIDGRTYQCCDECGNYYVENNGIEIDGCSFCSSECARAWDYVQCHHCGQWMTDTSAIITRHDTIFCSEECAHSDGYTQCEYCGDWVLNYETGTVNVWDTWCDTCIDNYACGCSQCGEWASEDNIEWINDNPYCSDCATDYECDCDGYCLIHEYGYNAPIVFFGSGALYLGVELEVDKGRTWPGELAQALVDNCDDQRFWMTKDSSLTRGLEVGAQPMDLREHIASGFWADVTETCHDHGYKSHDAGTCGLHIHVNRDYFSAPSVAGYLLTLLTQRFERELVRFSRRHSTSWCAYFATEDFLKSGWRGATLAVKANTACSYMGHSIAVNMQHENTFELRIFRGTLNLETLYASLALTDGLARYVNSHDETDCLTITWDDLASWIIRTCTDGSATYALARYLKRRNIAPAGLCVC